MPSRHVGAAEGVKVECNPDGRWQRAFSRDVRERSDRVRLGAAACAEHPYPSRRLHCKTERIALRPCAQRTAHVTMGYARFDAEAAQMSRTSHSPHFAFVGLARKSPARIAATDVKTVSCATASD